MHEERTTVLQDNYTTAGEAPSTTCQTLRVPVALFERVTDKTPQESVVEWTRLVGMLTQHDVRTGKDGRLWSPVAYGHTKARKAENVAEVSCLVLDFDDGARPEELTPQWEEKGMEFVIHTTHSHSPDAPKWRAIFPLSRAVPASEWEATYKKLTAHLAGGRADRSCKDVSRIYYLPSCPPEHAALAFAEHHPGRPLDPDEVPAPPEEEREKADGERRRVPLPAGAKGDYSTLDVVALFTVIWEARDGGWPGFYCSHNHCDGRRIEDVIAELGDADRYCAEEFVRRPRAKEYPLTDYGNAERLVKCHGANLRYCEAWGKWLVWDDSRWVVDRTGEVMRRAKYTIRAFIREALDIDDDTKRQAYLKHLLKSESERALRAMIALAQSEPGIPVVPEKLDTHPMLLTCKNGTLDLTTGELRPHRREDLITKMVPVEYDPSAECPTVDRFIADIFGNDPEMVAYIWRALGYALTGSCKERVMFILWGAKGNNGKTTLLELLADVLCDYSAKVRADTLMIKRGDGGIPNDLARLKGARFVFSSEGEENRRLAEALVKEITGGDTITARFMRAEWFDFKPEFKLFFATNHRPVIRGTDNAIWKRIHLIPFTERFVENPGAGEHPIDKDLPAKLRAELPGFLARMVKGCMEWQQKGLCPPEKVQAATEEYRAEMDVMADWIAECCVVTPKAQAAPMALYESYSKWCVAAGETPMKLKSFSLRLKDRGFEAKRVKGRRFYRGIGLLGGAGLEEVPDGAGFSGINAYKDENSELYRTTRHNPAPGTTRHPAPAGHQDPVGDEEICDCGRPAVRYSATGKPFCSECFEAASARGDAGDAKFATLSDSGESEVVL
jgi:P4 family phage/plasmid primase-like protien